MSPGRASHATRQSTDAAAPATGMPRTQAAGIPAIAQASVRGRSEGVLHSPAAAIPTATNTPTPMPMTLWAPARTVKLGAAALSAEPTITSAAPALSSARSPGRRGSSASRTAVIPPVAPDSVRS